MPLVNAAVLILHTDPEMAKALVAVVEGARGDVVICGFASEALSRLQQYQFAAAVIDESSGADIVEAEMKKRNVPYCKCASDVSQVVATLAGLLHSGR